VPADAAFLDRLDAVTGDERRRWRMDMFGTERTLPDIARMRLAEHVIHTWDIVVALHPDATVAADAAGLLLDTLPWLAERVGKPAQPPVRVHVTTTSPDREFLLDLDDAGVQLAQATAGPAGETAVLRLPAEAFLRLVFGRLDPEHTPSAVEVDGVELQNLRSTFPGV
jgi:uncharacterized protein (TIGR03083 family)